jgi:hypothetical protein
MRAFRFLSRVAFICNICFLLTSFVQWLPHPPEGPLISLVILMGYVLGIVLNVLVNTWLILLWLIGAPRYPTPERPRAGFGPAWILVVNFIFFLIQLTLILIHILK